MLTKIKVGASNVLRHIGAVSLSRRLDGRRRGIVLTLHRVLPPELRNLSYSKHMVTSTDVFEGLLIFLKKHYEVVGLDTLLCDRNCGQDVQKVAVTFDDGWKDVFQYALPALLRHQVPATVFICTDLIDTTAMLPEERLARMYQHCSAKNCIDSLQKHLHTWGGRKDAGTLDDWSSYAKTIPLSYKTAFIAHMEHQYAIARRRLEQFMSWEQLETLVSQGIEIGSHTAGHATLTAENSASIQWELTASRDRIAMKLGTAPRYLSYPNGAHNVYVESLAQETGYAYAFTTKHGSVDMTETSYAIPRIAIDDTLITDSQHRFSASRAMFQMSRLPALFART